MSLGKFDVESDPRRGVGQNQMHGGYIKSPTYVTVMDIYYEIICTHVRLLQNISGLLKRHLFAGAVIGRRGSISHIDSTWLRYSTASAAFSFVQHGIIMNCFR